MARMTDQVDSVRMTILPSHVVSAINAEVIGVVKAHAVEPTTHDEKQAAIDSATSAWRRVSEEHGDAGESFFLVTLATFAGMGFHVASRGLGLSAVELVDDLGVNIEARMIEMREFPSE